MDFRIADTFTASLGRLTVQEQKAVKTTAFDLQMDPSAPGLSFHRLDRAKDQNFWSVRVNADIRLIVHKTASSLLLAYVDHHDDAYRWAERRKIERHPTTGAMQLVVVRSREDIPPEPSEPVSARAAAVPVPSKPKLFDNLRRPELLAFGVPDEWIDDVRTATEDTLFDIIAHLPQEAQEALLRLAVGEKPEPAPATPVEADPYAHPDAQRRFRVLTNLEELQQALDAPWERWAVFLHPDQRQLATRPHAGPARVSGSAGTGKTVVALHRTAWLVRSNPDAKVLLTTFSKALANALDGKLRALIGQDPAAIRRVTVRPITGVGYDLYSLWFGQPEIASATLVNALIRQAAQATEGQTFPLQFLIGEWGEVVDAWQLRSWDDYRDVSRLGRKTRIGGKQRELLWSIFQRVHADLDRHKVVTWADLFGRLTARLREGAKPPFDHAVVDEAQDVSIPELRFLAALTGGRRDGLFLAGDLGQRIFQQPFSWKSLGVDVRGRSATLRINYRTSHQIRTQSDRLLPGSLSDVDGNAESRRGTVSIFDGPAPELRLFDGTAEEVAGVGAWIAERLRSGIAPEEIGVFVRSEHQLRRARKAVEAAGAGAIELTDKGMNAPGSIAIGAMHLAKGLEFRAVAVMACDEDVLPLQERIETAADESDLEEVYDTERHLLYVACTRARDQLLVTGVEPGSEFLDDMGGAGGQ